EARPFRYSIIWTKSCSASGRLSILVDVVQTIQCPPHRPDETTDRSASPSALAASRYSASCRTNGSTPSASTGGALRHLDGFAPLTRGRAGVFVTGVDGGWGWTRRCRTWSRCARSCRSGRWLHSAGRVGHLFDRFGPRPVRDNDSSDDRRDDH